MESQVCRECSPGWRAPTPFNANSKVGLTPQSLIIDGRDNAELPHTACLRRPPIKSTKRVRVLLVKTNSNPTTLDNEIIDDFATRLDVDLMKIPTSLGHASFTSIYNTLRCCDEVNKMKFKRDFFLTFIN
jgi:hypothetical protein